MNTWTKLVSESDFRCFKYRLVHTPTAVYYYLVVASFSPFLQSQTTMTWLSSSPTLANFFPSPEKRSKFKPTLPLHFFSVNTSAKLVSLCTTEVCDLRKNLSPFSKAIKHLTRFFPRMTLARNEKKIFRDERKLEKGGKRKPLPQSPLCSFARILAL